MMKVEDVIKQDYRLSFCTGVVVGIEYQKGKLVYEIEIQADFYGDYYYQTVGVPYVEIGEHVECQDVIGTTPLPVRL